MPLKMTPPSVKASVVTPTSNSSGPQAFSLTSADLTYSFSVSPSNQTLHHTHFGSPITSGPPPDPKSSGSGWSSVHGRSLHELPDSGRGDPGLPAIHIRHPEGHTVTALKYDSFEVIPGKPALEGLPATFGEADDVTTLVIHLKDEVNSVSADLSYSIFPAYNAIARSVKINNDRKDGDIVIEQAASFCLDMVNAGDAGWEMIQLSGDWAREAEIIRRKIYLGVQGISNTTGYSSHIHNPFIALVQPTTTETSGKAYGLSLIWTGSFSAQVEKMATGGTRTLMGVNPIHLAWKLSPGESFTTPECVAVYSNKGLGGMSRSFHSLYRKHLSRSKWTMKPRPALLNNWEATYFDFDAEKLYAIAKTGSDLGVKLFVMDDGWFGNDHPRVNDHAGLGDWVVNEKRFPKGLAEFVDRVNGLGGSTAHGGAAGMKFGIWVEPEMVNATSDLYIAHPDWILFAGKHERTEQRNQLVLNLALPEVQDYIIDALSKILSSANIEYVKWDNNRAMHEMSAPSNAFAYILGLYRVLDTLTKKFPDVLFEGCASGGGRFDPGILHYWCQSWTSDNTDGLDRLSIQFGTSLVYPASSMGCHVSAVPNHQTDRVTPLEFRAHVAMMGGSFGFELDLGKLTPEEQKAIPAFVALSERINALVIEGDMYRLNRPDESNWPAVMYVSQEGAQAVLMAYQVQGRVNWQVPVVKLQGLASSAMYDVEGMGSYSGDTLMNAGLALNFVGDLQSRVILISKQ